MKQLQQVREWHEAFGVPVFAKHNISSYGRLKLRKELIKEELSELEEADKKGDIQEIAKECCDLIYVTLGTFLELGWADEDHISMYHLQWGVDAEMESNLRLTKKAVDRFVGHSYSNDLDLILIHLEGYMLGRGIIHQFEKCFDEVHRSNMSKLGSDGKPVYREDGKVLKGPNYSPADLSFLRAD